MSVTEDFEILFVKARKESSSLVITIPKHVCDKFRIRAGSRIDLVLYNSFVVLKQRERLDYEREPMPEILLLLDKIFEMFRELKTLERQRYYDHTIDANAYDSRTSEIHETLREVSNSVYNTLKKERTPKGAFGFAADIQDGSGLLNVLEEIYKMQYQDDV